MPLALRFQPRMRSGFFKRHVHCPATHKPRYDLLGRIIEGRRQLGEGFRGGFHVAVQHDFAILTQDTNVHRTGM